MIENHGHAVFTLLFNKSYARQLLRLCEVCTDIPVYGNA